MKKIKLISLLSAGVIAATITTAAAASREEDVKLTEFEEQLLCGIYPYEATSSEKLASSEESYKVSKLLEHGVIDSVHPDNTIIGEDGITDREREIENAVMGIKPTPISELYKDELNAILAAEEDTEIKLTLVFSEPYNLWSGRFTVPNVSNTSIPLYDAKTFDIDISNGKSATMKSKRNYSGRFKDATVYATYRNNKTQELKKTKDRVEGTGDLTVNAPSVSNSTLVEAAFYFNVYTGDSINTDYEEVAVVHIVDQNYAKSAQYAENSYASMIDQYTYIEN